jgi:hypothetical protein
MAEPFSAVRGVMGDEFFAMTFPTTCFVNIKSQIMILSYCPPQKNGSFTFFRFELYFVHDGYRVKVNTGREDGCNMLISYCSPAVEVCLSAVHQMSLLQQDISSGN